MAALGEVKQLPMLENEGLYIAKHPKEPVIDDMDVQDETEENQGEARISYNNV